MAWFVVAQDQVVSVFGLVRVVAPACKCLTGYVAPVKVFIGWSGEQSRQIALHLRKWLADSLDDVQPLMSEEDIHPGARWSPRVAQWLDEAQFGVFVVTPTSLNAPWFNFEAGALGKSIAEARVAPLLFGGIRQSDRDPQVVLR